MITKKEARRDTKMNTPKWDGIVLEEQEERSSESKKPR